MHMRRYFFLSIISLIIFLHNSTVDSSLISNIQKLFSEKIEIFSPVEFSKLSIATGVIKIALKVSPATFLS